MRAISKATRRRTDHRLRRGRPRRGDAGFTFIELVVAMAIAGIVLPAFFMLARNLNQQSVAIGDTVTAVQQGQTAAEALYPILHSATTVLAGSNATTLCARAFNGYDQGNEIPNVALIESQLIPPAAPGDDAELATTLVYESQNPQGQTTYSTKEIGTYYAVPSTTVFMYGFNGGATSAPTTSDATGPTGPTGPTGGDGLQWTYDPASLVNQVGSTTSTSTPPSTTTSTPAAGFVPGTPCQQAAQATNGYEYTDVVAVHVDVSFVAGPRQPTQGFAAAHPTSFETTIALQNSTGAAAPTSTIGFTFPGTIIDGESSTINAEISPPPAGNGAGTVAFDISINGVLQSTSCSAVPVNNGVASCVFQPTAFGAPGSNCSSGGIVTATYSGDTSLLSSTSPQTCFTSMIATAIQNGGSAIQPGYSASSATVIPVVTPLNASSYADPGGDSLQVIPWFCTAQPPSNVTPDQSTACTQQTTKAISKAPSNWTGSFGFSNLNAPSTDYVYFEMIYNPPTSPNTILLGTTAWTAGYLAN